MVLILGDRSKSARTVSFDRGTKDELPGNYRYKGRRNVSNASIASMTLSTRLDRNNCATPAPEGLAETDLPTSTEGLPVRYGLFAGKNPTPRLMPQIRRREKNEKQNFAIIFAKPSSSDPLLYQIRLLTKSLMQDMLLSKKCYHDKLFLPFAMLCHNR